MEMQKLNVIVRVRSENRPNGKLVFLSDLIARMGGTPIARLTVKGRFDEKAAMREFKLFHKRFQPVKGWTPEQLQAIAAWRQTH